MVIIKSEVLGGGAQSTQVPTARCINQGRGRAEKPRRGKPESQPRGRSGGVGWEWEGKEGRREKGEFYRRTTQALPEFRLYPEGTREPLKGFNLGATW